MNPFGQAGSGGARVKARLILNDHMLRGGIAGGNLPEAQARYQQDRAACISGQSQQDRATCLKEAGAALQEAKRGRLGNDPGSYEQNRLNR